MQNLVGQMLHGWAGRVLITVAVQQGGNGCGQSILATAEIFTIISFLKDEEKSALYRKAEVAGVEVE